MKKVKYIRFLTLLGLICTLAFVGCQKDDILLADTKEIVLSANVKEVTFNITADNRNKWSITSTMAYPIADSGLYQDWFAISSNSGTGNVAITVSLKDGAIPEEDKNGALFIEKGTKSILIPVKFKK